MAQTVSLPNEQICVLGRADVRGDAIAFDWTNSGVRFRFRGTSAAIRFDVPDKSQTLYMQLTVDGYWKRICVNEENTVVATDALYDGEHIVECTRLNEVLDGVTLVMRDITLDGELLCAPPLPTRKMEFIGDSITCGFGVLSPGLGGGFTTVEEDGAHTYAALTARHFQAQANYICISGRGIARNCEGAVAPLIPEFYMQTTVSNPTPWDFSKYQPDLVVVSAGTNDGDGEGKPPENLTEAASAFLQTLRAKYPNAYILWVFGMMSDYMKEYLQKAVELQNDEKIRFFFVPSTVYSQEKEVGSCCHPKLRAHHRFAGMLIEEISDFIGWEK